METVKKGKYRHFKGHICEVYGVAKHSEDHATLLVIYNHPDEGGNQQLWARPIAMFLEEVLVDGVLKPRFEYIEE